MLEVLFFNKEFTMEFVKNMLETIQSTYGEWAGFVNSFGIYTGLPKLLIGSLAGSFATLVFLASVVGLIIFLIGGAAVFISPMSIVLIASSRLWGRLLMYILLRAKLQQLEMQIQTERERRRKLFREFKENDLERAVLLQMEQSSRKHRVLGHAATRN